jgi:hypothetical protein
LILWRQGWTLVCFILIFYFVRLSLCNKYSDFIVAFISIHSVIICVVFFGAYMRCTRLYPLKPGVTANPRTSAQSGYNLRWVDFPRSYNAILGRPYYAMFMAIPNYTYLKLKMPSPHRIITARSPSRRPKVASVPTMSLQHRWQQPSRWPNSRRIALGCPKCPQGQLWRLQVC